MKTTAALLLLALVLPACTEDKALIVLGESMISLSDQFAATATAMDKAFDAKVVTPEQYKAWAAFGKKFQVSYPLALHLWQTAKDHQDATLQSQCEAMIATMAVDLGSYAVLAGVK